MAAKAIWHRNYVTVTLCVQQEMLTGVDTTEKNAQEKKNVWSKKFDERPHRKLPAWGALGPTTQVRNHTRR